VLGICRGLEVLVVTSGGTLVPISRMNMEEVVAHGDRIHTWNIACKYPRESLPQWLGQRKRRSSRGTIKQRTRTTGWRVTAYAADGLIEALEEHHPWAIAVQWHPELSLNDPLQQRLFQALVKAARIRKLAAELSITDQRFKSVVQVRRSGYSRGYVRWLLA